MIKLKNVNKSFGNNVILDNLTFHFERGQCYYLKGVSGVGKTTLLNIIYGYEKVDNGDVEVNSKLIEYMFQEPLIFSNLSIDNNLKIKYLKNYEQRYINKRNIFDNNLEKAFKDALNKVNLNISLNIMANTLSGGECQRLQLAQYILSEPDILLLDEPACKLDIENRHNIYKLINEVFTNTTRIIITHDEEIMNEYAIKLELRGGRLCEI